nr:helix-turn-helix domain-containing protein [Micromonospora sp. RTGN7]
MVLWRDEGHSAEEVAVLAGVSLPMVNIWVRRYQDRSVPALADRPDAPIEPGDGGLLGPTREQGARCCRSTSTAPRNAPTTPVGPLEPSPWRPRLPRPPGR